MSKRNRMYIQLPDPDNDFETVYIAGKVTGRDYTEARAQFDARAEELEAQGYAVCNPMDFVAPGTDWQAAMRICIYLLPTCDYIELLPGWGSSQGALLEYGLACKLGIKRFGE